MAVVPPECVPLDLGDLVLRAPVPDDVAAVTEAFTDPALQLWSPPAAVTVPEWIDERADWSSGRRVGWVVSDAAGGPVLGSVSVRVDASTDNGMIGYWTASAARGRGVATRSVRAAARFAFDVVGLYRIELAHAVENTASCRVAERSGFLLEGTLREAYLYGDGRRHDEHLHAKLRTDAD
ncbi:GNAT family N-acetyltransferase [Dactylosporangium vinaceum]|uniref:GNAT family N-acetyltransferase n=1 Tax=Dactylosporangium vinaceum TaxID=53362 RepID=A0ABV5M431_9ACTN|nr:GNAT family protein [Dactylosporangium vinaceum]UAB93484.1 GNAT family N-acetyltransferase [Dactylosporangium vinaceum]